MINLNLAKTSRPTMKEELIFELVNIKGKGECFGYDGLMNKAFRTSTTKTLENTDFFILSLDGFDKCFNKAIKKAERERKDFLIERIPAFRHNKAYFNTRFKHIKTHV